ncbi:hypothetical protein TNCV_3223231 [Trichonephila clavipes]|nr:hypothetical protein TNCV_3223231 [Trichonephila clavipes]
MQKLSRKACSLSGRAYKSILRSLVERRELCKLKEGRFTLSTFRSERMRVLYRSRKDDRLRVMLALVHTDITPPHTPLPVFRRTNDTIFVESM